ncbi:MAG: hypothetical protein M3R51_03900 [Candidatus Eremiobacteraeota bacterium]|nr:hypothetical protein [Candidatus Eremiobacteraeota bacterium]
MVWIDEALASLSPADVAERISLYVRNSSVEGSYGALRRAVVRMPASDLAQLAIAFDLPFSNRAASDAPRPVFEEEHRQPEVLAYFLTVPNEFKSRFERFLHSNPRALAYFDDADAKRMLQLSPKRRLSRRINMRSPALVAALAGLVVLAGVAFGGWMAVFARSRAVQPDRVTVSNSEPAPYATGLIASKTQRAATARVTATPESIALAVPSVKPAAAPTVTPTSAVSAVATGKTLQGVWRINEANVEVGTIIWSGNAVLSRGNTIVLDLHKQSVAGRPATPCEQLTNLHAVFSMGVAQQRVPYQEMNCQGGASTGEVRVVSFSGTQRFFDGSFWQGGMKLGDFDARKQ